MQLVVLRHPRLCLFIVLYYPLLHLLVVLVVRLLVIVLCLLFWVVFRLWFLIMALYLLFLVVFLSFDTGDSPLSAISNCFLSHVASVDLLSTVSGHFLSFVTSSGPLSAVSGGFLSLMPPAGSWALFLTSILSHAHCSFLPPSLFFHFSLLSLPTPLICNSILLIRKRLFDQAFITQKLIASTQQQEEHDLSFG